MAITILGAWLDRAGCTKADLAKAASEPVEGKKLRYATVHDLVEGRQQPKVEMARRIAAATKRLVQERSLEIEPLTAAQILGVDDAEDDAA